MCSPRPPWRLDVARGMTCACPLQRAHSARARADRGRQQRQREPHDQHRGRRVRPDGHRTWPGQLIAAVEKAGTAPRVPLPAHVHHECARSRVPATGLGFPLAAFGVAMVISMLLDAVPGASAHGDGPTRSCTSCGPVTTLAAPVDSRGGERAGTGMALAAARTHAAVGPRAGRHFYIRAWTAARHGAANMNTLIALGTGAAFLFSTITVAAPWFARQGGAGGVLRSRHRHHRAGS